jgi:hypothetical protein
MPTISPVWARFDSNKIGSAKPAAGWNKRSNWSPITVSRYMATLYAQVRDPSLTLEYLQKAAATEDVDLTDLSSDPEFEFLWHDAEFERIVS